MAALQARYQTQVENLTNALTKKQDDLTKTKIQAEEKLKEVLEKSKTDKEELCSKLEKERQELIERHKIELEEREKRELEEREKRELEEREKRELEALEKKEADEKLRLEEEERKRVETEEAASKNDISESSKASEECEDESEEKSEEDEDEEKEETESEAAKRQLAKLQVEMLLLKQQNDEFEELVREKYRRQVELEIQIGEIGKEVSEKEALVQSEYTKYLK